MPPSPRTGYWGRGRPFAEGGARMDRRRKWRARGQTPWVARAMTQTVGGARVGKNRLARVNDRATARALPLA